MKDIERIATHDDRTVLLIDGREASAHPDASDLPEAYQWDDSGARLTVAEQNELAPFLRAERDGMMCESHPGQEWPHDDCPGPGQPWLLIGRAEIEACLNVRAVDALDAMLRLWRHEHPGETPTTYTFALGVLREARSHRD